MSHDSPAPRKPNHEPDETDETRADDPAYEPPYDPAKQAPVDEDEADTTDTVRDMVDVEEQEEVVYDLEDEAG
jgi:hypothetical protein